MSMKQTTPIKMGEVLQTEVFDTQMYAENGLQNALNSFLKEKGYKVVSIDTVSQFIIVTYRIQTYDLNTKATLSIKANCDVCHCNITEQDSELTNDFDMEIGSKTTRVCHKCIRERAGLEELGQHEH